MADINDAEIKIGVSINSDEFLNEYQALLKKVDTTTQTHISDAVKSTSGAISNNWGAFPFADMHNKTGGASVATQAFLGSLAQDLELHGIGPGSLGYQSALLNASNIANTPDPWQRFHQMLASGLTQQADLTHPDSPLGQAIASDYSLMQQPWSRDFIKKSDTGQYIDFDSMREYAVDAGLGRWKDEVVGNTADNFELINNELENISEESEKSEKVFRGWGDTLKNVLGTLTAIGSIAGVAKAFEVAYNASEKGTISAGTTLDKRRAFVGMSALDELAAQVASQSVGLGKDAITNEIINMSSNREKYKLLGEGLNALYPSLTGIFDNIMSSDNPMETYQSILKEVYTNMRGADTNTRAQTLMLLESQGLGSAAKVIGAMLSNESIAKDLGYDPTNLFSLRNNKYYSVYERAEGMLPDITKLDESIKTSYAQLYTDFTEAFGKPFKDWWDNVLQEKVIPWFEKFIKYINRTDTEKDIASVMDVFELGLSDFERNDLIELKSARAAVGSYKPIKNMGTTRTTGKSDWDEWLSGDMSKFTKGTATRAQWDQIVRIAKTDVTQEKGWNSANADVRARVLETQERAQHMVNMMRNTGLDAFLENRTLEDVDKYFLEAMQQAFAAKPDVWMGQFDAYIDKVLSIGTEGHADDLILEKLTEIAKNTEGKEALINSANLWTAIEREYGPTVAAAWKATVNRQ